MLLVNGNTKLGDGIYHFSLPRGITCKMTPWCEENCYAGKGNYVFPSVHDALLYRLLASKEEQFAQRIISEINALQVKYLRLHASGDFYDEEYIGKWTSIVKACPKTSFVAFTRRGDMHDAILSLSELPNAHIRESLDESSPRKEFPELYSAVLAGSPWDMCQHKCHGKCAECLYCWTQQGDVVMKVH